jgi:hypothetical protein
MAGRVIAAAAAAALAAGLTTGAASGPSSGSGVAVATGLITAAAGRAVAGVTVSLHAWPSDKVLQKLKPGQAVPWKLLATTTTSSAGTYALIVSRAALASAAVDNGYANLEIDSTAGEQDFSYQTDPPAGGPPASETINLRETHTDYLPDYCVTPGSPWIYVRGYFPEPSAVVGQGYVLKQPGTKGDFVTFDYTDGSSHEQTSSLGVGASAYGSSAGFSASGTDTETAADFMGFGDYSQRNVWFLTEFSLAEYRMDCEVPLPDPDRPKQKGYCPTTYNGTPVAYCVWKERSNGWFGGASVQYPKSAPATPYRNCARYVRGTHFGSDRGRAVQWSQGYEIGLSVNIKAANLKARYSSSSQTGYDSNAYMYYYFNHFAWLCGTNNAPSKAAQLVARDNLP